MFIISFFEVTEVSLLIYLYYITYYLRVSPYNGIYLLTTRRVMPEKEYSEPGGLYEAQEQIGLHNPLLKFEISPSETVERSLAVKDLTFDGSTHAINLVREAVQAKLLEHGFPNIKVVRGNPVVSTADNFDRLRFSKDNLGRSSTYTRYLDENHVLRTHTSAMVPEALDELAKHSEVEDITFIFPGLVYRRDVSDRTHLGVFHQMDIWRIQKNNKRRSLAADHLRDLVKTVFEAATPGVEPIVYDAVHPYTIEGIEVYAQFGDDELEVLEAGLAHPEVLANSGLDPEEYSGLALGMGIDRLVMARKGMQDIRLLRADNPKIASQMHDLRNFEYVSNQPDMSRDLSYVVAADSTPEDIAESLREAFKDNEYLIEEITVKTVTTPQELHSSAAERLGITDEQINVLVNIVLRHPDRTLTKKEINALYSDAYPHIHKGSGPGYI